MEESDLIALTQDIHRQLQGISEHKADQAFNTLARRLADQLIPHAAKKAGIQSNDLRRRLLAVNLIHSPVVNGSTYSYDGWKTCQIDIYTGLMIFFHKMIKSFVSRIEIEGDSGRRLEMTKMPLEDMALMAKQLIRGFWEGNLLQTESYQLTHLSGAQILFLGPLLTFAERFVVAHEFGHIVIHLNDYVAELDRSVFMMDYILSHENEFKLLDRDVVSKRWGEEIASDTIGLQLSLDCEDEIFARILVYSAAELVLVMLNMLEVYYVKTIGKLNSTHPPSRLRLDALRAIVDKSTPPWALEMGKAFEHVGEEIISRF